jgi:iron-sulfur cluster insertion protein
MKEERKPYLRVAVTGGGCSGFQYMLMLEENKQEGDQELESNGVKIIIDPISSRYLDGSTIDFVVDNLMAGAFAVKNPNAKSTCGCGQSFEA